MNNTGFPGKLSQFALLVIVAQGVAGERSWAAEGEAAAGRAGVNLLEEIIVTARRKEERELTVPITINSFSGSDLDRVLIRNADDLSSQVPAMSTYQDPSTGNSYNIRGVGPTFLSEPGVVTYVDDVPQIQYGNPPLLDLQSVQVLKGPQGTLFGKNSVGGAVLYVTQKPTDEFEGYGTVRYGDEASHDVLGAVSIPASDVLKFRVAAQYSDHDPYVDNVAGPDLDTQNRKFGRVSMLYTPSDTFENFTTLDGFAAREYSSILSIVDDVAQCAPFSFANLACLYQLFSPISFNAALAEQQALGKYTVAQPRVGKTDYDVWGLTNTSTLELGSFTLKNIFGYREADYDVRRDLDGTRLQLVGQLQQPTDDKTLTEELQLRGLHFDDRLDWVLGAFYSDQNTKHNDQRTGLFGELALPFLPPISPVIIDNEIDAETIALYGQFTYDLSAMLEGLKFTAGYRYSWDTRDFEGASFTQTRSVATCRNIVNGVPLSDTNALTCVRTLDQNFDEPSWNVNLEYALAEDTFIYFATRRGYKSGNFNTGAAGADLISFEPETLTDYEVGFKAQGEMAGVAWQGNIALYTGDYKAIQLQQAVFDNGNFGVFVRNIGDASVDGMELELSVSPWDWLEVGGYYAITDGTYDDDVALVQFQGEAFLNIAKVTAGLNMQISQSLGERIGVLTMSANMNYRSRTPYIYESNDPRYRSLGSYYTTNATAGVEQIGGSKVDVRFYVQNLTDDKSARYAYDIRSTVGYAALRYPTRRTYGIEASMRF